MNKWELGEKEMEKLLAEYQSILGVKYHRTVLYLLGETGKEAQKKLVKWLIAKHNCFDERWQKLCKVLGIDG